MSALAAVGILLALVAGTVVFVLLVAFVLGRLNRRRMLTMTPEQVMQKNRRDLAGVEAIGCAADSLSCLTGCATLLVALVGLLLAWL